MVFDEIGALESDYLKSAFPELKNKEYVHTVFFEILKPFLTQKEMLLFCAGRSEHLALASKVSPVNLMMLALSPFKENHIEQIIQKTHSQPDITYINELGKWLNRDDISKLINSIYNYTAGIPRYILQVLNNIILDLRLKLAGNVMVNTLILRCEAQIPKLQTPEIGVRTVSRD